MKIYLVSIFLFTSFLFFGQNQQKIDSIQNILKTANNPNEKVILNLELSKAYINLNKKKSENFALKSLDILSKTNNHKLLDKVYLQLGLVFYYQRKDSTALSYFNKIDSLFKLDKVITKPYFMSKIYRSEISKFTFTMEGVMQAKKYILEALALADEKGDKELINHAKYNLAEWHGFLSQEESPKEHLDTAKSYVKTILPYYKLKNDYIFLSRLYHTLASIEIEFKNYKTAEYYYKLRLQAIKKTKDSISIGETYYSFGSLYIKLKKPNKGISYLDSASTIFNKTGFRTDKRKEDLYKDYAYLYKEKGDYKNVYKYLHQALLLKDTIYDNENTKRAMELEKKYQTKKKEQEIVLLKTQQELVNHQKTNQRNLLLGGISLTTIMGLFFFFLYRDRHKTTQKLRELDKAKSNLFANISHEFRTPLTLISGPIQQQLKNKLTEKDRKIFNSIKRNTDRLLALIDQLLDITKIESGNLKLKVTQGNIIVFINTLTDSFSYAANQKEIKFNTFINPTTNQTWFDNDVIEKIVTNLLLNAVKYTPIKGTIICNALVKDNRLHFELKNTGKGILTNQINQIFDRFYQSNKNSKGVGIGLALVKELILIHKGKIIVKSTPNEWTTFSITIPINKNSFKSDEIINEITDNTAINQSNLSDYSINYDLNTTLKKGNKKPILLIVEDNLDVNIFIKNLFKDTYAILQAVNGKEGIKIALKYIPDIIISDIMMPITDGVTLCNTLKVDERTNHIPIILLTAKAGDENEIKGIEVGADVYFTKPFNNDLLKLKVEKLIESRKKLQTRYSQEVILKPTDIAVNSIDELFLERVQHILDTNLIETSFHIDDFCKAVGMSRMQLHRKLKVLTGLSTSEFICSQRLKLAAQLLKTSDINISQVGYSVGFNNHAYFSKCFKEAYNCTPSAYAQKNK